MVTVTGYTAERMQEIENSAIVDGNVVGNDLILTKFDGSTINAGSVVGPTGPPGVAYLGHSQSVAPQGPIITEQDITGCSVTVTVGAGRRIKITGQGAPYSTVANDYFLGRIREGATEIGIWYEGNPPIAGRNFKQNNFIILTPTAGPHTYKLTFERPTGTGSANFTPSATNPILILVEDLGPV